MQNVRLGQQFMFGLRGLVHLDREGNFLKAIKRMHLEIRFKMQEMFDKLRLKRHIMRILFYQQMRLNE